jgi:hypothetical protein
VLIRPVQPGNRPEGPRLSRWPGTKHDLGTTWCVVSSRPPSGHAWLGPVGHLYLRRVIFLVLPSLTYPIHGFISEKVKEATSRMLGGYINFFLFFHNA